MNAEAFRHWGARDTYCAKSRRALAFFQRPCALPPRHLKLVVRMARERWQRICANCAEPQHDGRAIVHYMCNVLRAQTTVSCAVVRDLCDLWQPRDAVALALRLVAANNVALTWDCFEALYRLYGASAGFICHAQLVERYEFVVEGLNVVALGDAWEAACTPLERQELRVFDAWMHGRPRVDAVVDRANMDMGCVSDALCESADVSVTASASTSTRTRTRRILCVWPPGYRKPPSQSRSLETETEPETETETESETDAEWHAAAAVYHYHVTYSGVDDDVVWIYAALRYGAPDVLVFTRDRCRDHVRRLHEDGGGDGFALQLWLQRHVRPHMWFRAAQIVQHRGTCTRRFALPCESVASDHEAPVLWFTVPCGSA